MFLHIDWDVETSKKGGYSHYMLKEIFDEPQTIRQALKIPHEQISGLALMFTEATRAYLMGVGTTYYVANISQYFFSTLANRYYPALSSDEFSVVSVESGDMVLALSQSGETYDTKSSLEYAKLHGAQTAAVVNVMGVGNQYDGRSGYYAGFPVRKYVLFQQKLLWLKPSLC